MKNNNQQPITGLHHVTAIASDAQKNLNFYAGVLGLRMVKKTVNFDAPDVYHLYYGDEAGHPGTIMTFFPFQGLVRGRKGKGQLTTTSFSIAAQALDYWVNRLKKFHIPFEKPLERFEDEMVLKFEDPDGLSLELVANSRDERKGFSYGQIPIEFAVKGFYGVRLVVDHVDASMSLLLQGMNHELIREGEGQMRFAAGDEPGNFVDLLFDTALPRGLGGSGTVHHLAFATPNDQVQLSVREHLLEKGMHVTEVLDRQYFHSIYFREPSGILYEVATSDIGFPVDEPLNELGGKLKLPIWQEPNRSTIEQALTPIVLDIEQFHD
jgi:glyoxalase family protein